MSQLLEKAEKAYTKKNFDYATELWSQHLKLKPDDLEVRKKLRKCQRENSRGSGGGIFGKIKGFVTKAKSVASKDPESTMISCEDSLKDDPKNPTVLMTLGQAALEAEHNETAAWVFTDLLSLDRSHKEARRYAARAYKAMGDFENAIQHYEALTKLDPGDQEAANGVRDLAAKRTSVSMQERTSKAKDGGGFTELINKDEAGKLERLTRRVRNADQARERIIDLKEALEGEPESTKYMRLISDMHVMCKEYAEAQEWLEKCLEIEPGDFETKEKLGDMKMQQYDDILAKLKSQAKSDAGAKAKYQKTLKEKQSFVVEEYKRRAEDRPTELKWAFQLGRALHDAGELDEAIGHLQKAKSSSKYKVEGGYYLGLCLFKKKNLRMSIKELETAREDLFDMSDDTNKKITYLLGRIYESAKKNDKALEEYEKIAQVDYSYSDVQKRVEALGAM